MQFRLPTHLFRSTQTGSVRQRPDDLELGTLGSQAKLPALDLRAVLTNVPVVTKLYEAPTQSLDGALTAKAKGRSINKKKLLAPLILLVAPALSASAIGLSMLIAPVKHDGYTACRASVCAGFASERYAFLGGGSEYVDWTWGNLEKPCLSHFQQGYYDQNYGEFVTFHRVPVGELDNQGDWSIWNSTEPCSAPTPADDKSDRNKIVQGKIFKGAIAGAAVLNVLILARWTIGRTKPSVDHWLDDNLRALLSPRLYNLTSQLESLSSAEQQAACAELMPVLQKLLAESVERFDTETMNALLKLGVSPNATVPGERNALDMSLSHLTDSLTEKLIDHATPLTTRNIIAAARTADVTNMMKMFKRLETIEKYTPEAMQRLFQSLPADLLMEVCASGLAPDVSLTPLLDAMGGEAKRFVNAQDSFGRTPLHMAVFWRRPEIAASLLAAGADEAAKDYFGKTPADVVDASASAPSFIAH